MLYNPASSSRDSKLNIDASAGSSASILSAKTLSAIASARDTAYSRVAPYATTPGRSLTSAIHRPSSSRSISISILMAIPNSYEADEKSDIGFRRKPKRCKLSSSSRLPTGFAYESTAIVN